MKTIQFTRTVFFCLALLFLPLTISSHENEKDHVEIEEIKEIEKEDRKWTIDNCVNQFSMEDTVGTKVGYQYWFADKSFLDGRTLKMSVVQPHSATHEPHRHAEDEFFFVLEGNALFILENDSVEATPYSSFYCPPQMLHGIRNIGDTELKYLVVKKYITE